VNQWSILKIWPDTRRPAKPVWKVIRYLTGQKVKKGIWTIPGMTNAIRANSRNHHE